MVLTQKLTTVKLTTRTDTAGDFVFPSVLPGKYSVSVQAPGFKRLEKTGLTLSAAERLSAGTKGSQTLGAVGMPVINGVRNDYTSVSIDGARQQPRTRTSEDEMNLDAVAEVKLLMGNYQAEYGKNAGAVVNEGRHARISRRRGLVQAPRDGMAAQHASRRHPHHHGSHRTRAPG